MIDSQQVYQNKHNFTAHTAHPSIGRDTLGQMGTSNVQHKPARVHGGGVHCLMTRPRFGNLSLNYRVQFVFVILHDFFAFISNFGTIWEYSEIYVQLHLAWWSLTTCSRGWKQLPDSFIKQENHLFFMGSLLSMPILDTPQKKNLLAG